ncbi:MAG TPA: polysaccharide lyase family protein [Verrucomicrobiota bacterium]|nr:polysaccharide lyase family protein [Verrucomicrobiota bacterium]HNU52596.1 polysaccharide lyase family protein [Verrucomicrobiota bacterium]
MTQRSLARGLRHRVRLGPARLVALLAAVPLSAAGFLWEIGKPDNDNREFALAPNRYGEFRHDGFIEAGRSAANVDWPYVHPGPADSWAGSRSHTFSVVFGLKALPQAGDCHLTLDLVDTHAGAPPKVRVAINGREFHQQLPRGAGDASIFGDPARGREHRWVLTFPTSVLRAEANEVAITTVDGSWFLYDWVALETPPGAQLGGVQGTIVSGARSAPVLVEQDGRLVQILEVTLRHLGDEATARVTATGTPAQSLKLRPGAQSLKIPVPAVAQPTDVTVSVEVGGKTVGTQAVRLEPVRKWVVYLLPHSHVDIGYTHVQTDVERAQWKYLEMAIDTARRTADYPPGCRFKWNVEVLWAMDSYLRQATPEKQQAFLDAVKAGQVGLQALYGNQLTGLCSPEELLRLVGFAQALGQRVGAPIQSAMITDVPGYTWGMVPTFAHSGVKYFSVGPNGGDRIGRTSVAWGDKPFWWIGPNPEDKVLVWMTGTGYYQVFQSPERLLEYLAALEHRNYPYDMVQVRHCLGDNGAPDVGFAEKVKAWNETHAYPRLVIATTDDMFRDFEQKYGARLPTARGDFTPYWEDGAASSARETALNRASAARLVQAETLFGLSSPSAYPADAFYQAWRNVLLYDEHTWGAHNSISEPDAPFVRDQWRIKQAFALDADAQSRKLLADADAARGPLVAESGASRAGADGRPRRVQAIDVVNTASPGDACYNLVVVPGELSKAGDAVLGSPTGTVTRVSQRLTTGELVFRPCFGPFAQARFYIADAPPATIATHFPAVRVEGFTLTSASSAVARSVVLRLDERTGAIASLKFGEHELVNSAAPTALNDYFYLPGSDLKGLQRNGPVKITAKETGPLIASLVVESAAPGCRRLTREYRLHALRNDVEIINTVDKARVRTKEGVHFGFGFNVPDGVIRMDVPWAVVRPELDQIPGACKNWFTVQRWVDVSNDRFGVTWLTPDAPLVQVGGITANLIGSQTNPDAWIDRLEPTQTIYSWAMNNHWHTNYRSDQEGPTVFRFYLLPHEGGFDAVEAARAAQQIAQPLLALPARGALPGQPRVRVVSDSTSGAVQVTTLKPAEDGKGWIVRLFGVSGKPARARLEWADPAPKRLWLSNAGERPLEQVDGPVAVPAWGIVTLRAEP